MQRVQNEIGVQTPEFKELMRKKGTHVKLREVERSLGVSKGYVQRGPNPDGVYYEPLPGSEGEINKYRRG